MTDLDAPEPYLEWNGMPFRPIPGVTYLKDYFRLAEDILLKKLDEREVFRSLAVNDNWWLMYFGMRKAHAHRPFVVHAANEVQRGPKSKTLDIWAREHFKSTIITHTETIQDILYDPNERIAIFSYTATAALVFYREIRFELESNEFLKDLFPDVLWANPRAEAPQWSDDGLIVKRDRRAKEATLEAWGLLEGMPTARHFTKRVYDDISTLDLVESPEQVEKCKEKFDMSAYVGSDGDRERIIGTFYSHDDPLTYIRDKKKADGTDEYALRLKPGTEDGTYSGKPVLISEERNLQLQGNKRIYSTQILCNPTPKEDRELNHEALVCVSRLDLPSGLWRIMIVDPAGDPKKKNTRKDNWAMWVLGIAPYLLKDGSYKLYILDGFVGKLPHKDAVHKARDMYLRNVGIQKLVVEKVGASTAEIHIADALRAKGKNLTLENGRLHTVHPGSISKEKRIIDNLQDVLNDGLIHYLEPRTSEYQSAIEVLKKQMEDFPHGAHDDAPDALSYWRPVASAKKFGKEREQSADPEEERRNFEQLRRDRKWREAFAKSRTRGGTKNSWMGV